MKIRTIVYCILTIILVVLIVNVINNKYNNKKNNDLFNPKADLYVESIINNSSDVPSINIVSKIDEYIEVDGGVYNYGDVNRDNIINIYDLNMVEYILTNNFTYTDIERILSDLDQNKIVDENDYNILKKYLDRNDSVKYQNNKKIYYCMIREEDNINNCLWQNENKFIVLDNNKYHIYIKYNEIISDVYQYELFNHNYLVDDDIVIE